MKKYLDNLYKTYLSDYIPYEDITNDQWNMLKNHIETHKYWLNEEYEKEISISESFTSWMEYVFEPFIQMIEKYEVMKYTNKNIIKLYEEMMYNLFMMRDVHKEDSFEPEINHVIEKYCYQMKSYPKWKKFKMIFMR